MAIHHHIESLRVEFPDHFKDRDESISPDDYIVIPTDEPHPPRSRPLQDEDVEEEDVEEEDVGGGQDVSAGEALSDPAAFLEDWLAGHHVDVPLEPLSDEELAVFGGHPGGLINNPPSGSSGASTAIERLAFYLPFHSYRTWWGIYILPEGIQTVRRELMPFFSAQGIGNMDQVRIAKRLLYYHEYYHHAVESFGTRLEAITNFPMYDSIFNRRYCETSLTPDCYEETCANSYARERVLSTLQGIPVPKRGLRAAINLWFDGQPPGYCEAAMTTGNWKHDTRTKLYEDYLNLYPGAAFYRPVMTPSASQVAWSAAGNLDRGIGDIRSRISYLVRKGSSIHSRLPLDARTCLKLRSFKQKLKDCHIGRYVRHGGNHELWSPWQGGGRLVPIPRHEGRDLPTGTMRAILRELGCQMSIEEFLAS